MLDGGTELSNQTYIISFLYAFFKDFFGRSGTSKLDQLERAFCFALSWFDELDQTFSLEEIREAIFSFDSSRAPRPDGFTFELI